MDAMPPRDMLFWLFLTIFGTGTFIIFEQHLVWGVAQILIGLIGMTGCAWPYLKDTLSGHAQPTRERLQRLGNLRILSFVAITATLLISAGIYRHYHRSGDEKPQTSGGSRDAAPPKVESPQGERAISPPVSGQARLAGTVHMPGKAPLIAREEVSIEGAGKYVTDDRGEFEFELVRGLKVGHPARFHVNHVNPAIKVQQWIVIHPCDLQNGRMDALPDIGTSPVRIVVLPRGDQRLLDKGYSVIGCILEEEAAVFPAGSQGLKSSSLLDSRTSLSAAQIEDYPLYKRLVSYRGADLRFVEATYPARTNIRVVQGSRLSDQTFLKKRAEELGFTPSELAAAINAWAESAKDSYEKGLAAFYEKRYADASKYILESIPSPTGEFLKRYVLVARAEYELGHYSEAEAALRKVLTVQTDDPLLLNNLGLILDAEGKYSEALPFYKRALEINERDQGPESPAVAINLNNLGGDYNILGDSKNAELSLNRARAIDEKALGPDDPSLAIVLNNIGFMYKTQGHFNKAAEFYNLALNIDYKTLGPNDPSLAAHLNNLGVIYLNKDDYDAAEPLLERAKRIFETALGPNHPDLSIILNNLGRLYEHKHKYQEAESSYKRALNIDDENHLGGHPNKAIHLNNLALFYRHRGRYAEAEPLLDQAQAIDEKALGPFDPSVAKRLNNLALVYMDERKYVEAEPLLKRALDIKQKAFGPDDRDVAETKMDLAEDLYKQGRVAEGKVYFDQAAKILRGHDK